MREEELSDQLVRAADGAHLDVDLLVRGGATRGRKALLRRRIATSVAALSTAAVLGVAAIGVPALLDDDSAPVAAEQRTAVAAGPSGQAVEELDGLRQQPARPDRAITIDAADVPRLVGKAAGAEEIGSLLTEQPYVLIEERNRMVVHFRLDGTLTTVVIDAASDRAGCAALARESKVEKRIRRTGGLPREPRMKCQVVEGIEVGAVTTGTVGSPVKVRAASAWNHGYKIDVVSYNVAAGKNPDGSEDVPPLLGQPRIDGETLVQLATSEAWFA